MIVCLLMPLLSLFPPAGTAQSTPSPAGAAAILKPSGQYLIGPGDELSAVFPFNAELNHDGLVGPDGRFTVPLLGSLDLGGQTVDEASVKVTKALHDGGIVSDAYTSITVRHYGANVYIGGEVRLPGLITLSPQMDPLQAVIAAGGLLDTARTKRVAIIRRAPDGRALITYVNLRGYTRGLGAARIMPLQPRDVVFVPKSSIAEADSWVDLYLNRLLPFGKSLNYSLGDVGTTTVAK